MSWNAYLTDDRGHEEGSWNYTHNCNGMIEAVLDKEEVEQTGMPFWASLAESGAKKRGEDPKFPMGRGAWWHLLDGKSGPDGAAFLDRIIRGLEAEPERFRAMNPENGWGDYDSLVKKLIEMRNAVPEWPTEWRANG